MLRMIVLAFLGVLCAPLQSSLQVASVNSAEAWRALSTGERAEFVFGFQQGALYVAESVEAALSGGATASTAAIATLQLTSDQARTLTEAVTRLRDSTGQQFGCSAISEAVTRLYDDPANAFIKPPLMITVAQMRMAGRAQAEVEAELESWRKVSAPRGK